MKRYAAAILLAIGLTTAAPLVFADNHDNHRYYDKNHKDYHQWNENEDRNFSVYLGEKHIKVHTWKQARPSEQQQYWNWRHEHPDEKR